MRPVSFRLFLLCYTFFFHVFFIFLLLSLCLLSLPILPLFPTWGHEQWCCYLLVPHPLWVNVYCQLKNNSLRISPSLVMLHLLDMSVGRITSKSGYRDLCLLCSWHRFRAISRKPAGCFTLQINPTTGGNLCERQESWHVNAFLSVSLSCHLSQLNDFSFNVIAFWRWEFPLSLRLSISKVTLIAVI